MVDKISGEFLKVEKDEKGVRVDYVQNGNIRWFYINDRESLANAKDSEDRFI